ncbi:2-oxoglutarate dehydrogenase complex component E1-like [Periplaneta americana]|uniref:2-oxoglutarate dehydrogenase complex component E1-like n=1 Tax=Periplaneta americana TaxID=6978 RepID=UPI0037E93F84
MTVYNNWIKDRCSVGIQWDSYFQQTLLRSLHDETSNLPKYRTHSTDCHSTPETEYEKPECSWSKEVIMSKYPEMEKLLSSHLSVVNLIRSYQMRGHLEAKLDPLKIGDSGITDAIEKPDYMPPARIVRNVMEGITEQDKSCIFQLPYYTFIGGAEKELSLKEIIYRLEKAYCQHIGVEYTFIRTVEKCQYIRQMFETPGITELNEDTKKKILYRLTKGVMFEKFILKTIGREKKFGLEGGESLIPALGQVIDMASCAGVNTFIIGMAHRGRLNVLANICKRPLQNIFSQFSKLEFDFGSGDVKYHLGSQVKRINAYSGKEIDIIILPNPSHLETVSPIVIGRTRSEQFFAHDEGDKIMSIMIHGDAAFSGQGVVYETLNLSKLPNYTCRGTIHFVINNQIGFTTDPRFSRSSTYCTDVGRIIKAPIFHVNGDDPEALIHCCNVAVEYRNKYKTDVIIDIVCYRRYGHNEVDDPGFTQPLMYKRINKLPNTLKLYTKKLVEENVVTSQEAKEMSDDFMKVCEEQFQLAKKEKQHSIRTWLDKSWDSFFENQDPNKIPCTGVKEGILKHIGVKVSSPPPKQLDFEIHTQLEKLLQHRMDLLNKMSVDWAMAEAMAFGSLLIEGNHVRLSGEDVERGTFGHRHAVYHHQSVDKETYMPLKHLSENQGDCTICNSSLCEYGIVGFELGYSMTNPNVLVMWEAQFGDFLNTAQTVVDCYLSSGEDKWHRQMGLVLLLPHGMEGAGPEHSSARMERFLQMCKDDPDYPSCLTDEESVVKQMREVNWIIANPTTPANYFHVLRRQIKMPFRKPLILFTPKILLRGNTLRSALCDLAEGTGFQRVLFDLGPATKNPKQVKRLIFCSGRVFYDLYKEREMKKLQTHIAISRIEELCPFPFDLVRAEADRYPNAEICWVQEEHKNSGAWSYILPRFSTALQDTKRDVLVYVGRPPASAPATGKVATHTKEWKQLMHEALDLGFPTSSSTVGRFWHCNN